MGQKKLPEKVTKVIEDFVKRLEEEYKGDLISVALYGSSASGEFTDRRSNINVLVVLKDARIQSLSAARRFINSHRLRAISPIFFDEGYIRSSADVFPVEFLDMKENNRLLYGKDVLSALEIDAKNLRFQCEHELKAKIVAMKQFYLKSPDKATLISALFKSFTSSMHILRNIVRLKASRVPAYSKEDIMRELSEELRIDPGSFKRILDAKKDDGPMSMEEAESLFLALVSDLEKIAVKVDGF